MATNLRPYEIIIFKKDNYSFITDNYIEYLCYFTPYSEYFPNFPNVAPYIYSFNLELGDKTKKPKSTDIRIADTVIKIIGDFLEAQNNAVVYVCDNSDGREAVRARKFKSRFSYYDHPSTQISQIIDSFTVGGMLIYCAMLIHHKNKRKKEFIDAFLSLTTTDESNK